MAVNTDLKPKSYRPLRWNLEPNPALVEHARERAESVQNRIADHITVSPAR
jgi:hypothetical protein